jgi:hypothetical protein
MMRHRVLDGGLERLGSSALLVSDDSNATPGPTLPGVGRGAMKDRSQSPVHSCEPMFLVGVGILWTELVSIFIAASGRIDFEATISVAP